MTLSLSLFFITLITIPWFPKSRASRLWMLGFFWTSLTVAFEFLFGHYARGASLGMLLTDYNLLKGRLWSLVVITTLVSPVIAAKIRGVARQT